MMKIGVAISMALIVVMVSGCGGGGGSPQPAQLGLETLAGYGRPNTWAYDMLRTELELEALSDHGIDIYTIELAGARDFSEMGQAEWISTVREAYPRLIRKARELGVTVLVSVGNDNAGSGKYGQNGKSLGEQTAFLQVLVDIVDSVGPECVILQPCAETHSDGGRWLEDYCVLRLKGFVFAYNGEFGSPKTKPTWATWRVWHSFTISEVPAGDISDCIVVGDTGSIIDVLGGMTADSVANVYPLQFFAEHCKKIGAVACIYYAFRYDGEIDFGAMEALRKGIYG